MRAVLLAMVAAALLILAILTRGSLGSGVCIFCLIMMGAALLVKHFLINRDSDMFDQE